MTEGRLHFGTWEQIFYGDFFLGGVTAYAVTLFFMRHGLGGIVEKVYPSSSKMMFCICLFFRVNRFDNGTRYSI